MARRSWASVEEHFASRHRPYGRNVDPNARARVEREPKFESGSARNGVFNRPDVQDPEDTHASNYDNRTSGWVRGAKGEPTGFNETATNYPGGNFDRGSAWRQPDGSIHGPAGDHREQFVKPGSESEFEKRRK